jgi:hypothetical protein
MPKVRIPLFGTLQPNEYSFSKGQTFFSVLFREYQNPVTGEYYVKASPRKAWSTQTTVSGVTDGKKAFVWVGKNGTGIDALLTAWDATNSKIVLNNTLVGTMSGTCQGINETSISSVATALFVGSDSSGWYYPSDAGTGSPTFSGDTHNGTAVIDNIASTAGMYSGQSLSGTGVGASARILTVDSSTQITATVVSSASATVTITRSALAKIIDTDYPGNAGKTVVGNFAVLDGWHFIMTSDGTIYQSDLNSISGWTAAGTITANQSPDAGIGVWRYLNTIAAFGKSSLEFFRNAGNPVGSVLLRMDDRFIRRGASSANAITAVEDTLAWVSSGEGHSGTGIYILENFASKKISDEGMDTIISGNTLSSNYLMFGVFEFGSRMLVFKSTEAVGTAYQFDLDMKIWSAWAVSAPSNFPNDIATAHQGTGTVAFGVSKASTTIWGMLGRGSGGHENISYIITKVLDFGTGRRKFMKALRLVADKASTTNTYEVSWSDDDEATFSTAVSLNLITTNTDPKVTRLGSFYRRAFKIALKNDFGGIEAIEVEYEEAA